VRADRLLSLLLLLRSRGRMSAAALAAELEVSARTVLRDVEALSAAGIPVYAERGRAGGFALLPGFTTDLTGLTPDEALALLAAGSRANAEALGLAPALASAMRKVLAAMPESRRAGATEAAGRVAVRRAGFLREPAPEGPLDTVREAVFAGRRLRIRYAARGAAGAAGWRTVDPVGLVDAGGRWYLLAVRDGADRTYRMSRITEAVVLDEPADRPSDVDLERLWEQRRAEFAASLPVWPVTVLVRAERRAALVGGSGRVRAERPGAPGWLELELDFGGPDHAAEVLWRLGPDAQALAPPELRRRLADRAAAMSTRYPPTHSPSPAPTHPPR
jgi:predicted DNA-binding transcriptional regulator YafY